jgi:hypothetical protein
MINAAPSKRGQPLTFGEVIQETIAIYRANFVTLSVLSLLIVIPVVLLMGYLLAPVYERLADLQQALLISARQTNPTLDTSLLSQFGNVLASLGMIVIAVSFVQIVLLNSAVTYIASESYFGARPSIMQTFQAISPRLPTLGLALLIGIGLVMLVFFALAAILFACGLGFGVVFYAALTLIGLLTPVAILERHNILGTVGRGFALAKLHVWAIFRASILILFISQIASLLLTPLTASVGNAALALIIAVVSLLVQVILSPLLPIATTILYYDARNRYEGLGTLLAAANNPNVRPADIPAPATSVSLNSRDLSNIVVMCVVVILLFGVLIFAQTLFAPLIG